MSQDVTARWAGLLEQADEKRSATRLNSHTGNGGGAEDLKSEQGAWTRAGEQVSHFKGTFARALRELRKGHAGAGSRDSEVAGLASVAALERVVASWEDRVDVAGREAGELAEKFKKAGRGQHQNDDAVRESFQSHDSKPKPPPGGPSAGW